MRPRASAFIATSLDGFIARDDGSIDWLDAANKAVPQGEDCGYKAFMETVDTLVMGRATFDLVLTFGMWPYDGKRVVVLTSRPLDLPAEIAAKVTVMAAPPAEIAARLAREGAEHLYVDGGKTIQSFLAEGLLDAITITTIPVLLGAGKPLFGPLARDRSLVLEASKAYDFGYVQSRYRIANEP